jgi:hypothetical protein
MTAAIAFRIAATTDFNQQILSTPPRHFADDIGGQGRGDAKDSS